MRALAHAHTRITGVYLPLDRANALYNMTLLGAAAPGMHWYAEAHVPALGALLHGYAGFPTMNKRLLWYAAGMPAGSVIHDWLAPTLTTPWWRRQRRLRRR